MRPDDERWIFEHVHGGLVLPREAGTEVNFADATTPRLVANWVLSAVVDDDSWLFVLLVRPQVYDEPWTFWPLVLGKVEAWKAGDRDGWVAYPDDVEFTGFHTTVHTIAVDDPFASGPDPADPMTNGFGWLSAVYEAADYASAWALMTPGFRQQRTGDPALLEQGVIAPGWRAFVERELEAWRASLPGAFTDYGMSDQPRQLDDDLVELRVVPLSEVPGGIVTTTKAVWTWPLRMRRVGDVWLVDGFGV